MENGFSVVIIGAGQLGTAVGTLLRKKNVSPVFWDADSAKVPGQKSLEEAIRPARCVLLCIPSWAMRKAITDILPFLASGAIVVSFAKGIELGTQKFMGELLAELLPAGQPNVLVGGPMLAQEIAGGKKAIGVFASSDAGTLRTLSDVFSSSDFTVEVAGDPLSVSVAGVLKNIYAVGIGVADGLWLSNNEKGWLASVAIREMSGIASLLGADPKIISGTAGVGDFVATAWSANSQNRQIGVEIAAKGVCTTRGEGFSSIAPLIKRLGSSATSFPLLNLIRTVSIDCKPAHPAFEEFFQAKHS